MNESIIQGGPVNAGIRDCAATAFPGFILGLA